MTLLELATTHRTRRIQARKASIRTIAAHMASAGDSYASSEVARAAVAAELRALGVTPHLAGVLARLDANRPLPGPAGAGGRAVEAHHAGPAYRAAYLVHAAQRVQAATDDPARSGAEQLATEQQQYLRQHLDAQLARERNSMRLDAARDAYGETLGWYAIEDERTTPECAAADGKNFRPGNPPTVGLPGVGPHVGCRCYAGPPHEGAEVMRGHGKDVFPVAARPTAPAEPITATADLRGVEIVLAAHHHVKGTPYRYTHGWHPIDAVDMRTWVDDQVRVAHRQPKRYPFVSVDGLAALRRQEIADARAHNPHPYRPVTVPRAADPHPHPKRWRVAAPVDQNAPMVDKISVPKPNDLPDRQRRAVTDAVAAVNQVHHDGTMRPAIIQANPYMNEGVAGEYRDTSDADGPLIDLTLRETDSPYPAMTAVHEIGHYLDKRGLGDHSFASETAPAGSTMARFLDVAHASPTVRAHTATARRFEQTSRYADYLDRPAELWGRAYAQYIATRSGSPALRADLDRARAADLAARDRGFRAPVDPGPVDLATQWPDAEFAPIGAAVEAVLAERGWLNQRAITATSDGGDAVELGGIYCGVKECYEATHSICICHCRGQSHGTHLRGVSRPKRVIWVSPRPTGPGRHHTRKVIVVRREPRGRGRSVKGGPPEYPQPKPKRMPGDSATDISRKVIPDTDMREDHALGMLTATAAIDKVHHDGRMHPLTMRSGRLDDGTMGEYWQDPRHSRIALSTGTSPHPALTAAHELGHYIDFEGLGYRFADGKQYIPGSLVQDSPAMRHLQDVLQKSPTIQRALTDGVKARSKDRRRYLQGYVQYLTSPPERFARAYAQWIALRSQDPTLLQDVRRSKSLDFGQKIRQQWPDQEFAPIAEAFDALFAEKGWLN